MSNKDHYCGISTNLAEMNQRVLSLTRRDRGDCMDDVNEGSATEPCVLSLFPGGWRVLLSARQCMVYGLVTLTAHFMRSTYCSFRWRPICVECRS